MPPPPEPMTSTSTVGVEFRPVGHGARHRRPYGESRDQLRSRAVEAVIGHVGALCGERGERRDPRADLMRGVARLVRHPRGRPVVDVGEMAAVNDFQESVIPLRVERRQLALAVREVVRRLHHRGLTRLALLCRHRLAEHDPAERGGRGGGERRNRRVMGQPTGADDEHPLVQGREVVSDGCAQCPRTTQRAKRCGDRVDEDRDDRVWRRRRRTGSAAAAPCRGRPPCSPRSRRRRRLRAPPPPSRWRCRSGTSSGPSCVP